MVVYHEFVPRWYASFVPRWYAEVEGVRVTGSDREKVSSSVRLEGWQREWLKEHDYLNVSELFRRFVDELASGDRVRPDGLEFRKELLEEEIEDLQEKLQRKRENLASVKERLEERGDRAQPAIGELADRVRQDPDRLDPTDAKIQSKAEELAMTPEQVVDEVADELDGVEWTISSSLKSVADRQVRFDRDRFDAGDDPLVEVGEV